MTDILAAIGDTADDLASPYVHTEVFRRRGPDGRLRSYAHRVTMPSLLDQLADAVEPGAAEAGGQALGYESQPPARLDAVDRGLAIEAGAARWCVSLNVRLREDTAGNVRALVGAAATVDSDTQRALLDELRSWLTWARVVTGWQTPPWRPIAPCPACEVRQALRVRMDGPTAMCMQCGAAWDQATIGVLASYISEYERARRDRERQARRRAVERRCVVYDTTRT